MRMRSRPCGQRILVTGASGFIGSHLCFLLRQEGAEVHAVYRTRRPADLAGQQWWQADLADLAEVKKIVGETGPEVIFNLASLVKAAPDFSPFFPALHNHSYI